MPRKPAPAKKAAETGRQDGIAKPRRRDAEVLDAAAEIFYERGYATATVQDVADSLGMLKGSLYYYIDSKEDLLYRLLNGIHDGVDEVLVAVEAEAGLTAIERLELYVKRAVEYNARNLKKVSVYYHDIDQLTGARRKEILARRRGHEDHVATLIRQAQADGDAVADLDAKLLTNCVFGTVIWMYRWYRPGRGISAEVLSEACARFVRYGLRGDAPPRPARCKASRADAG
jgi:TetR/AcrR family transcriptional regulator, cholesterol catabolism regulator